VGSPPREVPVPTLYHLIRQPEEGLVDHNLPEDADTCVVEVGKVDITLGGLWLRIEKTFFSFSRYISHQVQPLVLLLGFGIFCPALKS
jgi:hypothetical protein